MVEVIIDLKEVMNIENSNELVLFVSRKLNIPYKNRVGLWDAFSDNFSDIFDKFPENYKFSLDDEWGWNDYNDYNGYIKSNKSIGPKDENGNKGDMKFILRNFREFKKKNHDIAMYLLDIFTDYVDSSNNHSENELIEWYFMTLCIES